MRPFSQGAAGSWTRIVPSRQLVRFVLAGMLNTAFGYGAFLVALALFPTTLSALVASTIVAVLFNFVSQGLYVFRAFALRRLPRFCVTYLAVFAFNAVGLSMLERFGIVPQVGGLMLLPGAVLISYGMNSRWVFGRSGEEPGADRVSPV